MSDFTHYVYHTVLSAFLFTVVARIFERVSDQVFKHAQKERVKFPKLFGSLASLDFLCTSIFLLTMLYFAFTVVSAIWIWSRI